VIRDAGKWRINHQGINYGYYDDAEAATQVAIVTAHAAGKGGAEEWGNPAGSAQQTAVRAALFTAVNVNSPRPS
jgi:hypothetical protein